MQLAVVEYWSSTLESLPGVDDAVVVAVEMIIIIIIASETAMESAVPVKLATMAVRSIDP